MGKNFDYKSAQWVMERFRLEERYEPAFIDKLRKELLADFDKFVGGFPSYLDYMSRTIESASDRVSISPEQIQSYKTVSNFLVEGMTPKIGSIQFFHAYLLIAEEAAARRCEATFSPSAKANDWARKRYKAFRGRSELSFPSHGIDVFSGPSGLQGEFFGLHTGSSLDLSSFKDGEEFSKQNLRLRIVIERQSKAKFDLFHAVIIDPQKAIDSLDSFSRRAKEIGVKNSAKTMNKDWIIRHACGPIFWDGLRFEGELTSVPDMARISVKGFNYIRLIELYGLKPHKNEGDYIIHHSMYDYLDMLEEQQRDLYGVEREAPIILHDWINVQYHNHKTGSHNSEYKGSGYGNIYLPNDLDLISNEMIIRDNRYYSTAENKFRAVQDSHLQLKKVNAPYRTDKWVTFMYCDSGRPEKLRNYERTYTEQLIVLLKLFIRYNNRYK